MSMDPLTDGGAPGVTERPVWRELNDPDDIADALVGLYVHRGTDAYDEVVTQNEHALQCASYAMAARADDSVIVAAFLHDIGHLIGGDDTASNPSRMSLVDRHHEDIGARFLANWFGEDVTEPVRLHVPAKRYLCAVDPDYIGGLSPASLASLELQGGPMHSDEVRVFASLDHGADAVALRRWDDMAKVPGAPTPGFDLFRNVMVDVLRSKGW